MVRQSVPRPRARSAGACERRHSRLRLLLGVGVAVGSLTISPLATAGAVAPGSPVSHASAFGNFTGVSCVSPSVCMVTGEVDDVSGGSVIGTTDGGRTWQQLASPPGVDALAAVSCATAVICEVAGSGNGDAGAVYGTTDGGQSWTTQPAVIGGGFFLAIACPSIEVCEATGNEGMIFGTVNGGASWTQQKVPASADLVNGISCPSTTTCEAVGYGVGAMRTSDGGTNWVSQALPSSISGADRGVLLFAHALRRCRHRLHTLRAARDRRAGLDRRRRRQLDPPEHPDWDRRPDERCMPAIWRVRSGRTGIDGDHRVDRWWPDMDAPGGSRVPVSSRRRVPRSADMRGRRAEGQ